MSDKRLQLPPELVQLNFNVQLRNADIARNTIYMQRRGVVAGVAMNASFDDGTAADQAHKAATAWGTVLAPLSASDCALLSVDWVWNEHEGAGPLHEGTYSVPSPITGEGAGESLPSGVSKALTFKTGLGGRGNHGRIFIPAIPKGYIDAVNGDELSATFQATYASSAAAWLSTFNNNNIVGGAGDEFSHVVVSFILHGALRTPASYHAVTQVLFREFFLDYQRRRAPLHARHH